MNLGQFDDNIRTEYFNGKGYKFNAVLFNDDGLVYKLNAGYIEELIIQDDILNWVHQGTMTLQNPHNAIERSDKINSPSQTVDTPQFKFRSDGRDYLYLYIEPLVDETELVEINQDFYTINIIFSIYKIEDISDGNPESKKKRLYFWDYRYQYMVEKNIRWSTAYSLKNTEESQVSITQLSDDDRSMYCGEAIMDFLSSTFKDDFGDIKFNSDWNPGSNKIFYSSPNESKAVDDLECLLEQTVSTGETNNEPCILRLERTKDHMWSLLSLSEYFKKSTLDDGAPGPFQNETFTIAFLEDNSNPIPNRPKSPRGGTTVQNVHIPHLSEIKDFEFVHQSGLINQRKMVTTVVNGYDFENKQFNTYQFNIDDIENEFQSNIIDNAYSSGETKCKANFFINQMKQSNHNIRSMQSTTSDNINAISYGRNTLLHNGMLTGNTVKFSAKGNTNRQAGRFISLERPGTYDENSFDDMILGQYFTVAVNHIFHNNMYDNDVIAVKPFAFKDPNHRKDII